MPVSYTHLDVYKRQDVTYGTVKEGLFQSALDFLKQKKPLPSKLYRELEEEARAKAFTVSGYTTMEILEQFLQELEAAIEQGTTKEEDVYKRQE